MRTNQLFTALPVTARALPVAVSAINLTPDVVEATGFVGMRIECWETKKGSVRSSTTVLWDRFERQTRAKGSMRLARNRFEETWLDKMPTCVFVLCPLA